jgi:hypothetical protein
LLGDILVQKARNPRKSDTLDYNNRTLPAVWTPA